MQKYLLSLCLMLAFCVQVFSQGTIRGTVYDQENGEPVMFANVFLEGTTTGTTTNIDGFYNLSNLEAGEYRLVCTYLGYDSTAITINVTGNSVITKNIFLKPNAVKLGVVNVSAKKEEARTDIRISTIKATQKDIKIIPSTGGEPDLAQYLQILPGVVFTGDQGGQLYIRGGSPVQNKVLLDGMTIYNPFHSIGFFSVFETETIRNVEVLTGGFNAEYGGRTSAVIDIITRDGNKTRYGGIVSASPFQAKTLIEGPLKKLKEGGGGSSSFLFTAKHSYIDQTSPMLYGYASDAEEGLPYSFTDIYGKVSFNSESGSKLNLFGFNHKDKVDFINVADLDWDAFGAGANFVLIPTAAKMILGGKVAYSDYNVSLTESDDLPRNSGIKGSEIELNFSYFGDGSELKYGFEINTFTTSFDFINFSGIKIEEVENTTELAGYFKYKKVADKLVFEPSLRIHYYASLSTPSVEPRLGVKYNLADNFRVKFAGGLYSQNLISTVNDRDIVNLFVGFLSSPEQVYALNSSERTEHNLQKSVHGIAGIEIDLANNLELNIEPYIKRYTQLISLNRNKTQVQEPNFRSETGDAKGIDFLLKYKNQKLFLWLAYSLGSVTRYDGEQNYSTNFDRRHNMNAVANYAFGANNAWEVSARWNLGSGFPFTLTQGFYQSYDFQDGINSDYLQDNGDLGIIYSDERNTGRLPYYHRLDMSLKRTIKFTKYNTLDAIFSVTNVYDRNNIFYFDRIEYERVDQLPILPSIGLKFTF